METNILIIPGLGGSGDNHWQSFWSGSLEKTARVEQENWDEPELERWLEKLNEAIEKLHHPVILVAHSLAVSLVLHWAARYDKSNIKGALLVAPADVDSPEYTPDVVRGFAPMPTAKLAFPSIVVASLNDPYIHLNRAKYFAEQWGSEFINIGKKGHINSDSNLGIWEEGQLILEKLRGNNTQV